MQKPKINLRNLKLISRAIRKDCESRRQLSKKIQFALYIILVKILLNNYFMCANDRYSVLGNGKIRADKD